MSIIIVTKLDLNTARKCTACGLQAVLSVTTQNEWEHRRNKKTTCFSLCNIHGVQFAKNIYAQANILKPPEAINEPQPPRQEQ